MMTKGKLKIKNKKNNYIDYLLKNIYLIRLEKFLYLLFFKLNIN